jgi:hypothetical protein
MVLPTPYGLHGNISLSKNVFSLQVPTHTHARARPRSLSLKSNVRSHPMGWNSNAYSERKNSITATVLITLVCYVISTQYNLLYRHLFKVAVSVKFKSFIQHLFLCLHMISFCIQIS